jgi:A/G-specific adenine glycosylase
MLQQTQVERVVPKWKSWICRWPNWQSLSKATNRQLLIEWQGLGYNRRALALGAMARDIVRKWHGETPRDIETLLALPGIGPYTANAILIFAYNEPCIAIDTNIRRVLMHELGLPSDISRANLEQVAQLVLPKTRSRDWHNALMDYSAIALPKSIPSIPPATKQSRFKGSLRELRGEIIRELTKKRLVTIQQIATKTHRDIPDVRRAAESLEKENVISLTRDRIRLR